MSHSRVRCPTCEDGVYYCPRCGEHLPAAAFRFKSSGERRSYCVECDATRSKARYDDREYVLQKNTRMYNKTPEWYREQHHLQGGVCAICLRPESQNTYLCIDHDHTCCPPGGSCGKCVRGLICSPCNRGLGNLGDSLESLQRAVKYLEGFHGRQL